MERRASVWRALGVAGMAGTLIAGTAACTRPSGEQRPLRAFIIGVRDDASPDDVADDGARHRGASVHARWKLALRGFAASMTDDDARTLAADSRVAFVEPDIEVTTQAQTVPTGISRIGAPGNANLRINGASDGAVDADVAVVDTGSDLSNPDLNVSTGVNCTTGSCRSGGAQDDNGHGSHVSGTIGAKDDGNGVVGVAPGARIVPVKVLGRTGSGSMANIVAGLDWVAANASTIDVVNMSLGGAGQSTALNNAVANLVNRGVVVVVAAGNSNRNASGISPANNPDVITVSALADYNGGPGGGGATTCRNAGADDRKATFSNWGSVVDIAAPGVCILSLKPGGGTAVMSGTSMASPHVAGAVAILASRNRPRDRAGVLALRQTLLGAGTGDWTDDASDGIREPLLNVGNASVFNPVMVGGSTTPPTSTPPTTTPGTTPTTAPPVTTPPTNANLTVTTSSLLLVWRLANLSWSGLPGTQVTVYRNNTAVATVANNGSHQDVAGLLVSSASYRVCAAGSTSVCTNTVTAAFSLFGGS
jgi:subtilisin family serine protease